MKLHDALALSSVAVARYGSWRYVAVRGDPPRAVRYPLAWRGAGPPPAELVQKVPARAFTWLDWGPRREPAVNDDGGG